jgi:mannose-6-phosphate isomerase-like protein (cupin superfamily)
VTEPVNSVAPVPPPPAGDLPRRVEKPWGHEIIWAHTAKYVGKLLVLETGKRLSFQYHEAKDEWIHVLEGRLLLTLEDEHGVIVDRELGAGEGSWVPTGRKHRYTAIERATLIEVSTPELDDVVRLSDDYGREGTNAP